MNAEDKPWEALEELVEQERPEEAEQLLDELPAGDAARAISRLDVDTRDHLFELLPPETTAELVESLPDAQAADAFARLSPEDAAAVLRELPSDEQADLVATLEAEDAARVLSELPAVEAEEARELAAYPHDVAGGLMAKEFLAYPVEASVADVVRDLRRHADEYEEEAVQYVYAVSDSGALVGVLPLRGLLLARGRRTVADVMIPEPLSVTTAATLDDLADVFDRHAFLALPVVGESAGIEGVVLRTDVEEALGERSDDSFLKSQGIVHEEFRSMRTWVRSRRRLAWLAPNVGLNLLSASVIAFFQDTLAAVIALACFLPIVSDMSGCSGNQAVAVSMRELALGLVKPYELRYVWLKEVGVGLINGLALGLLVALVALAWKGNPYLGLVVGGALATNTVIAVLLGGTIPLALKRFGIDPALASGPILTTVTDMSGFLLVLGLGTALLPWLSA